MELVKEEIGKGVVLNGLLYNIIDDRLITCPFQLPYKIPNGNIEYVAYIDMEKNLASFNSDKPFLSWIAMPKFIWERVKWN